MTEKSPELLSIESQSKLLKEVHAMLSVIVERDPELQKAVAAKLKPLDATRQGSRKQTSISEKRSRPRKASN